MENEVLNSGVTSKRFACLIGSPWFWLVILLLAVLASLLTGAYPMPPSLSLQIFIDWLWIFDGSVWDAWNWKDVSVMTVIRPPRILVATCAGIVLGLAGASLQGIMRNPLVSPDLVGVSSGAAFGGVLALIVGGPSIFVMGLAFLGGMLALACTFSLANLMGVRSDGLGLILAGFFGRDVGVSLYLLSGKSNGRTQ